MSGKTKHYTDDFKKQILAIRDSGRSISDIAKEYGIAKSTISKWEKDFKATGSFKAKDNRSDLENELIALRKQNKQLLMENDILKQAALIMARR